MSIILKEKKKVNETGSPITEVHFSNNSNLLLDFEGILWIQKEEVNGTSILSKLWENAKQIATTFDVSFLQKSGPPILAIGYESGGIELINWTGTSIKNISDAHNEAVIKVLFSPDGQTIVSASEDLNIKLWSRNGILRSELCKLESPVYSICWSPDCNQLIYGLEKCVFFKSLKPGNPETTVRVTTFGVILSIDWSITENLIVTSGEDCRFQILDSSGQILSNSGVIDKTPVLSVQWSKFGPYFAGCTVNTIFLADRLGKIIVSILENTPITTFVLNSSTSQAIVGHENGQISQASFVFLTNIYYKNFSISFKSDHELEISDIHNDYKETLDFPENPITLIETKFDRMLVISKWRCSLHDLNNLLSPSIFDLPEEILLFSGLSINACFFVLQMGQPQCLVFDFLGKQIHNVKIDCQQQLLSKKLFDYQQESIALVDLFSPKTILFISTTGKIENSFRHSNDIQKISFNKVNSKEQLKILFMDSNKDLFILFCSSMTLRKVNTIVNSFIWHESLDVFAYTIQQKIVVVYAPSAYMFDAQLVSLSSSIETIKGQCEFCEFNSLSLSSSNEKNVTVSHSLDSFVIRLLMLLEEDSSSNGINNAMIMSRFLKHQQTWAVLAIKTMELEDTVNFETCLGQLGLVDKVKYLSDLNALEDRDLAHSQSLLLLNKFEECEKMFLSKKKIFEAVRMNCKTFKFARALELAKTSGASSDWMTEYVLMKRGRFIKSIGKELSTDDAFKGLSMTKSEEEIRQMKKTHVLSQ